MTIIIVIIMNECPGESVSWSSEVANRAPSMPLASPTSLKDSKQGQLINRTINVRMPILFQALGQKLWKQKKKKVYCACS